MARTKKKKPNLKKKGRNSTQGIGNKKKEEDRVPTGSGPSLVFEGETDTGQDWRVEASPFGNVEASVEVASFEDGSIQLVGGVDLTPVDIDFGYNPDTGELNLVTEAGLPGDLIGVGGGVAIDTNTGEITGVSASVAAAGVEYGIEVSGEGGCRVATSFTVFGFGYIAIKDTCEPKFKPEPEPEPEPEPQSGPNFLTPGERYTAQEIDSNFPGDCPITKSFTIYAYSATDTVSDSEFTYTGLRYWPNQGGIVDSFLPSFDVYYGPWATLADWEDSAWFVITGYSLSPSYSDAVSHCGSPPEPEPAPEPKLEPYPLPPIPKKMHCNCSAIEEKLDLLLNTIGIREESAYPFDVKKEVKNGVTKVVKVDTILSYLQHELSNKSDDSKLIKGMSRVIGTIESDEDKPFPYHVEIPTGREQIPEKVQITDIQELLNKQNELLLEIYQVIHPAQFLEENDDGKGIELEKGLISPKENKPLFIQNYPDLITFMIRMLAMTTVLPFRAEIEDSNLTVKGNQEFGAEYPTATAAAKALSEDVLKLSVKTDAILNTSVRNAIMQTRSFSTVSWNQLTLEQMVAFLGYARKTKVKRIRTEFDPTLGIRSEVSGVGFGPSGGAKPGTNEKYQQAIQKLSKKLEKAEGSEIEQLLWKFLTSSEMPVAYEDFNDEGEAPTLENMLRGGSL